MGMVGLFLIASLEAEDSPKVVEEPVGEGDEIPQLQLVSATGNLFDLHAAARGQWTLIAYNRGAWCPYGNRQLKELRAFETKLLELECAIIALSPEMPSRLLRQVAELEVGFVLLSDEQFDAARSFGLMEKITPAQARPFQEARATLIPLGRDEGFLVPRSGIWIVAPNGKVAVGAVPEKGAGFVDGEELVKRVETLRATYRYE